MPPDLDAKIRLYVDRELEEATSHDLATAVGDLVTVQQESGSSEDPAELLASRIAESMNLELSDVRNRVRELWEEYKS